MSIDAFGRAVQQSYESGSPKADQLLVIEPRPWGRSEWTVAIRQGNSKTQWIAAELTAVTIDNPFIGTGSWPGVGRRGASDLMPHRRVSNRDDWFVALVPLLLAMKTIEEAATGKLGRRWCSPAWVTLWLSIGLTQHPTLERMNEAASLARELAERTRPRFVVSDKELHTMWHDRNWSNGEMTIEVAYAELDRINRLARAEIAERTGTSPPAESDDRPTESRLSATDAIIHPARTDLKAARMIHREVREAYTAFCFDPHAVLARPLLNDVSDDLTAAFYQAQESADQAEMQLEAKPDRDGVAEDYQDAVQGLASAWDAADVHARECGVSHLSTAEQNDVRKARRTLDLALNWNTPAGEREAAYRTVLTLMAGLVRVPAPAIARMTAQIETVQRRQLTAGTTT